jgi:hypothetical protein
LDLHVWSAPEHEKVVFVIPSECLYVCMDVRLASTWTAGRIVFIFGIQEFIHHMSVPGEYEHSSSKNRGSWNEPNTQNCDILENGSSDFN